MVFVFLSCSYLKLIQSWCPAFTNRADVNKRTQHHETFISLIIIFCPVLFPVKYLSMNLGLAGSITFCLHLDGRLCFIDYIAYLNQFHQSVQLCVTHSTNNR